MPTVCQRAWQTVKGGKGRMRSYFSIPRHHPDRARVVAPFIIQGRSGPAFVRVFVLGWVWICFYGSFFPSPSGLNQALIEVAAPPPSPQVARAQLIRTVIRGGWVCLFLRFWGASKGDYLVAALLCFVVLQRPCTRAAHPRLFLWCEVHALRTHCVRYQSGGRRTFAKNRVEKRSTRVFERTFCDVRHIFALSVFGAWLWTLGWKMDETRTALFKISTASNLGWCHSCVCVRKDLFTVWKRLIMGKRFDGRKRAQSLACQKGFYKAKHLYR